MGTTTSTFFNMRTSTQLLSGLGFLALLAPASAQSSSSIIESSFESSSTILSSSVQSSSEISSTAELSSTTGVSSSSEVSSTLTSSEVSSFTTPSSSLSTSFVPSSSASESSLSSFSSVLSSSTVGNLTTSSTASSTSSSATPTGSQSAPFFLTIQTAASKRRQLASGSYLAVVNGLLVATDACTITPPTAFTIDADRLRAGDSFATATAAEIAAPGYSAVEFSAVAAAGDVQTVFAVGAGLTWTNAAFLNGAAGFCLLNNVVQAAYTVPVASIADCVPITLTSSQDVCDTPVTNIIIGVEISIEITIINVVNVINGATVTATSTETKTVTNPITGTSGPVVTSSVGNNGTVYYTTTVACAQCQCPGYVPGQLTVIATKSVCPVCVASTVTPVTATVIPCATCAALVPGTVTQTGGGKPSAYTVLVPATTAAGTPGQQTPVVTATAVAGNPTSPVTYTGAASSISAKGAVFGIVVGLFLSLC